MTHPTPPAPFRTKRDERLPWISDKPQQPARGGNGDVAGWIAVAMVALAGASYWAGLRSVVPPEAQVAPPAPSEVYMSLPEARGAATDTADEAAAPLLGERAAPATSAAGEPAARSASVARPKSTSPVRAAPAGAKKQADLPSDPYPLWPANKIEDADGRVVRIGSFESEAAARKGWDKILAEYPGMARLQAVVVGSKSLRDGRTFYRLQVGTSSQAHSEVLCHRSSGLGLECNMVGLIVSESE